MKFINQGLPSGPDFSLNWSGSGHSYQGGGVDVSNRPDSPVHGGGGSEGAGTGEWQRAQSDEGGSDRTARERRVTLFGVPLCMTTFIVHECKGGIINRPRGT